MDITDIDVDVEPTGGIYWAADTADDCHRAALWRIKKHYDYAISFGLMGLWRVSHRQFYSGMVNGAKLRRMGSQGELRYVDVNHYANILQHLHSIVTQNRPQWDPKATNTDHKTLAQVKLAGGVLDYFMRVERGEQRYFEALTYALQYGHGAISVAWDALAGQDVTADDKGNVVKGGDLVIKSHTPDDIIVDVEDFRGRTDRWVIVRELVDKWELAARYPQARDTILASTGMRPEFYIANFDVITRQHHDVVEMYTLYHDKTPACPQGRKMVMVDKTWLSDEPLGYERAPVFHIIPQRIAGSRWGYTVGFDLLPIQELINSLYSTIATNQTAFGVTRLLIPNGSNISVEEVSRGLAFVMYDSALPPPKTLEALNTPAEIGKFIQMLEQDMQVLSGVNSVQRGNPDASLKSGSALAMVQSMAIQFVNGLQAAYVSMIEDSGTAVINILKSKAAAPRVAVIAGKSNRSEVKEFVGDDLSGVDRVLVDVGSPMSRTPAQRLQTVQLLGDMGMLQSPEQVVTLIESGRVEPAYEGASANLLLIRDENERLMAGECPPVLKTDDPKKHLIGHSSVLSSTDSRKDGNVVVAVTKHLQMHIDEWRNADPNFMMAMGYPPMLQPALPPGAPPGGGMPPAQNEVPSGAAEPLPQPIGGSGNLNMPSMPMNPATGQRVQRG